MNRITEKDLYSMVKVLNEHNPTPYNYQLDMAYGGYKLVQQTKGGGQRDISNDGFGTKRQLYSFMRGFIAGMTQ